MHYFVDEKSDSGWLRVFFETTLEDLEFVLEPTDLLKAQSHGSISSEAYLGYHSAGVRNTRRMELEPCTQIQYQPHLYIQTVIEWFEKTCECNTS